MLRILGWRGSRLAVGGALAFSLSALGCGDSLLGLDDDGTQAVRVALSVSGEGGQVTYATSSRFTITPLQDRIKIELLQSDTIASPLPLEATFQTGERRQLLFLVTDRASVTEPILLQVWLDDKLSLQREFAIDEDDLTFVYQFGAGLRIQDLEIV